jgi:hypothetical protein
MLDLNPQTSASSNVSLAFAVDVKESRFHSFVEMDKNIKGIALAFPTMQQMESLNEWTLKASETLTTLDYSDFKRIDVDFKSGDLIQIAEQQQINKELFYEQIKSKAVAYLVIGFPLEAYHSYAIKNVKGSNGKPLYKDNKPILEVMPNFR